MTNINDLYNQAAGADDSADFPDNLTQAELPNGTVVSVEAVWTEAKTRTNGGKTFAAKFEVTEGEHKGGQFFDSIHLSNGDKGKLTDGQQSYNKRLFAKLAGAGLDGAFFSTSPSDEAIATALKGTKLSIKVQWQKPNEKGEVWMDNTTTWSPIDAGGGGGYVPGVPAATKGF
jgi:hypothetical protein